MKINNFFLILIYTASFVQDSQTNSTSLLTTNCPLSLGCYSKKVYNLLVKRKNIEPDSVEKVNLTLFYYNLVNNQRDSPQVINVHPKEEVHLIKFNHSSRNYFIVHGWMSSVKRSSWMKRMKNLILNKDSSSNVFLVDWSGSAYNFNYDISAKTTQVVGKLIADFIHQRNISPNLIHLIGHSLGAQIVGVVGGQFNGTKIARITGLDAARPLFEHDLNQLKLDSSDADLVEMLYTNAGQLGQKVVIGHVNIYPNGGNNQPGCELNKLLAIFEKRKSSNACDHNRATFIESTNLGENGEHCSPIAYACEDWESFLSAKCTNCGDDYENCTLMGFHLNTKLLHKSSKKYFLKTGDKNHLCLHHYLFQVDIKTIRNDYMIDGELELNLQDMKESVKIMVTNLTGDEEKTLKSLLITEYLIENYQPIVVTFNCNKPEIKNWSGLIVDAIRIKPMSILNNDLKAKYTTTLCPNLIGLEVNKMATKFYPC